MSIKTMVVKKFGMEYDIETDHWHTFADCEIADIEGKKVPNIVDPMVLALKIKEIEKSLYDFVGEEYKKDS
jgi:hypothetical protein